jgi:hypothetical protein
VKSVQSAIWRASVPPVRMLAAISWSRGAIGVVFQQSLLDPLLTVRENLRLRATFYELKDTDKRIAELAKLGFYNVQDFVKDDNGIERLKQMARTKTAPVVGIKVTETFSGTGKRKRTNVTTEIKLADKSRALELLGKHLGIFEKDNRQKSQQILIKRK